MKPNQLTTIRFLLLFFVILADQIQLYLLALLLIGLSFLTDFLDGFVARRYKKGSEVGVFYDHFVDKVFVHVLLIYYLSQNLISFWIVALLILRDYVALGFRQYAISKGENVASVLSGKIKLISQGALLVLIALVRLTAFPSVVLLGLEWLIVLWSFVSLIDMGWKNKKIIQKLWKEL
ncbi:CDP-alcohol phosphatidyltransferase family protein [Candidatus Woesearchaeota archaeon]|nr:CDP-alcohol phosphatidyltransferase family protein [Candidatus Woesearchaeota archaeon]